jgi:hypothetical protein
MEVKVLRTEGLDIACEAMRLSFNSVSNEEIVQASRGVNLFLDDVELLKKLILEGDSAAKVTRMATVWLDLTMPRYWWSEFDTYRIGCTEMSESSVHRLQKRIKDTELSVDDFHVDNEGVTDAVVDAIRNMENAVLARMPIESIKQMLPESFLQRRIVCTNYQTLRHIYFDRRNHRLPIWHRFLDELLKQLPFPEFITIEKGV